MSTIAVYPFDDLAVSGDIDYFARGLSENLTFRLSHIPGLRVISATTASAIKQSNPAGRQLKNEYGIGVVIKGSIQKSKDHIRVIVQLINTADGGILWSAKLDKPLNDVFTIQDTIAQAIADTLKVKLTSTTRPQGITVEAFEHYLIGRFYWNKRHQQDTERAIEHFNQAIKVAPDYAEAHAGLGDSYIFLNAYGDWPMEKAYPQAEKHLTRALELNPRLAEAYASYGQILMNQGDNAGAEKRFLQAIAVNPNYVTAYHWYGILLNNLGRHVEALKQHTMAHILDPLSAIVNRNMAFSQLLNGNKTRAASHFDQSLVLAPVFFGAEFLALNFHPLSVQAAEKAILFIKQNYQAIPLTVPHKITLSLLATSVGDYDRALQLINEAQALLPGHPRILDGQIALKAAKQQWPAVIGLLQQRIKTLANTFDNTFKSASKSGPRMILLKRLIADDPHKAGLLTSLEVNSDVSIVNAAILSAKGDQEQAMGIVKKLLDLGWIEDASQQWWSFADDPALAGLKQHPQFADLVKRVAREKAGLGELFGGAAQ